MLAKESAYWQKSEHLCIQKISSWPLCTRVGDHGDPYDAFAERFSA